MPTATDSHSDAELLAAFVEEQSEGAFSELVRRHMPLVLGVCRRVLEEEHAAQDASQAVFLTLARKAGSLNRGKPIGGWLHHVALCTARNERTARERRIRREHEAASLSDESAPMPSETAAELRAWFDRELNALPPKYRDPLVLVHMEGHSLEEAALKLRCKDGTLRVWLNRGREKLRTRFLRRGIAVSTPALLVWMASSVENSAAGVPADLSAIAAKSAIAWISGGSTAGGIAPKVVLLAKSTLQSLFMSKLKTAAVFTAVVAAVSTASALSWQKVNEARSKGLPKTAIEQLTPIIANALQNRKHAEAIKAICLRITLEGEVEGGKAEEKITRLQKEIASAAPEMKPLMEAVLAHWFWQYFQQNRHRFMQRTRTGEPPGDDFTTWDLPRILAEVDTHFSAVLSNEKQLQATPITHFDDLLEKGNTPDTLRPTVFDFLAHEALQFYQAGEQGLPKEEDAFEITDKSPAFAAVPEFLLWQLPREHAASPKGKAVALFQKLLAFHQNDSERAAFWDADLWRLQMARNLSVGPEKDEKFKAALERLSQEAASSEVASRALWEWARLLQSEGANSEAHRIAQRGADLFPESFGGQSCRNLILEIEAKRVQIRSERVWNAPWPEVSVEYRNIKKAYFRAYAQDFEAFQTQQEEVQQLVKNLVAGTTAGAPVAAWEVDLPPTPDFQSRVEKVGVVQNLKPGFYHILASHDPSYGADQNVVSWTTVWVSDLGIITRPGPPKTMEGFVLHARSGEPVEAARVRAFVLERQIQAKRTIWKQAADLKTDANGMFRFRANGNQYAQTVFLAESGDSRLSTDPEGWFPAHGGEEVGNTSPRENTVFFTDRALYRPGQIIQYKGVYYSAQPGSDRYGVASNRSFAVVLRDANHREIARQSHTSNDFGSFSGSFNAPVGTVSGMMQLAVENGPGGFATVHVEEYKRPKFQVELLAPKDAPKLGMEVRISGRASAYSGASVGGAKVVWRVAREVQLPPWCWWGLAGTDHFRDSPLHGGRIVSARGYPQMPGAGTSAEIARGTASTSADGAFDIEFKAAPDLSVPEGNEPVFTYRVYADVTDLTGETRSSSRAIHAGYTALSASITAEEWQEAQKPVQWSLNTRSLDGQPQSARGTVRIHALKQPETVIRAALQDGIIRMPIAVRGKRGDLPPRIPMDPANPESWDLGTVVEETAFETDGSGGFAWETVLKPGIYRAMVETADRFGKKVTARHTVQVFDPKEVQFPVRVTDHLAAPQWSVEPGQTFRALWGTGYERGRAYVEWVHRNKTVHAFWTDAGRTQQQLEHAVSEEMRGGFVLRVTFFRENRAYLHDRVVDVPWTDRKLSLRWEHFVSKLDPGNKQTWTAVISGPNAASSVAELAATLYDSSLDQYKPHAWMEWLNVFRHESPPRPARSANHSLQWAPVLGGWVLPVQPALLRYRHYPADILQQNWHEKVSLFAAARSMMAEPAAGVMAPAPMAKAATLQAVENPGTNVGGNRDAAHKSEASQRRATAERAEADGASASSGETARETLPALDLGKVSTRKNLQELAFFFPKLVSDSQGTVRIEFTVPEALTEWRFMAFAHDKNLRSGFLTAKAVTSKEVLVEPNPPRFLREGDVLEFTVKVSNQSPTRQNGKVSLEFSDAHTRENRDRVLGNTAAQQSFDLPSHQSASFSWRITIPDGTDFLTYKVVAATERASDGEEGMLPVLSRRVPVIESIAIPLRGPGSREITLEKLLKAGSSATLRHQNLTVQMVSQPSWYAVMALPYLMENEMGSIDAIFNRFYANSLARHIAESDPKIRRIFELWRGTPALESPLEKNQALKSVLLEETPWLKQGRSESESRRNLGILFDYNRLESEAQKAFDTLAGLQRPDGLWAWFSHAPVADPYMSLYIATGFGRMRHLGAAHLDMRLALRAWGGIDAWMEKRYREQMKPRPGDKGGNIASMNERGEGFIPSSLDALYLYGRSFFLQDLPVTPKYREMTDFLLQQARTHWVKSGSRQTQGHLALALKRFGDLETPAAILKSVKEHSVSSEELGLFWRDTELSWSWARAPIETQALMIEAFDEVLSDTQAVEGAKVWLLKQKQTQDWKTTKATADAVYALLLRGAKMLGSDALVGVSLGGVDMKPDKVEPGTGFYERRFFRDEIKPEQGVVRVLKKDEGVSWGSVHWEYLEDMAKVTAHAATPLKVSKTLYRKINTKQGPTLELVEGKAAVGEELVCRIEVRVDRDMEYVHLKDQRGSGTEPVNVLSHNKIQDGLAYFESTRDTASHFFIHYLPKGTYVFEYSLRVQHRGRYQSGIATIQSLYAPEFNAHTESAVLEVK